MDVTVVVGTFGSNDWVRLAHERAIPSVTDRVPVIHRHGTTLAQARNEALSFVGTEYVCHLDADDELTPDYIDRLLDGTADVRVPAVEYVRNWKARPPYVPRVAGHRHECGPECLSDGNYCVVGSMVRTDLVRKVGGWREFAIYEDWDLFLRLQLHGATFETIPEAVYRAHVNTESRNRAAAPDFRERVHREIVAANA